MKKSILTQNRGQEGKKKADTKKFEKMLGALEKKVPQGATFDPGTCIRVYCIP